MYKYIRYSLMLLMIAVFTSSLSAQTTVGSFKLSKYKDIKTSYSADKQIRVEVTGSRVVLERNDGTLRMTAQKIVIISRAPQAGKPRIDNASATGGVELFVTDGKQNRKARGHAGSVEYIGNASSPQILLKGGVNITVEEADFVATQKGASGVIDLTTANGAVNIESVTLSGSEEQTEATYSSKENSTKK